MCIRDSCCSRRDAWHLSRRLQWLVGDDRGERPTPRVVEVFAGWAGDTPQQRATPIRLRLSPPHNLQQEMYRKGVVACGIIRLWTKTAVPPRGDSQAAGDDPDENRCKMAGWRYGSEPDESGKGGRHQRRTPLRKSSVQIVEGLPHGHSTQRS